MGGEIGVDDGFVGSDVDDGGDEFSGVDFFYEVIVCVGGDCFVDVFVIYI